MNRSYCLVLNKSTMTYHVAPETAGTKTSKKSTPRVLAVALATTLAGTAPLLAHAGSGSCAGTASVVVSDAQTTACGLTGTQDLSVEASGSIVTAGEAVVSTADSAAISNDGLIQATGLNTAGVAIRSGSLGRLDNAGTIEGDRYGVDMRVSVGQVNNSGTIRGRIDGLFTWPPGNLTNVVNTGTIEGGVNGIRNDGHIETLVNSGSIDAQYFGIHSNGTIGTIQNSGAINGGPRIGIGGPGSVAVVNNSGSIAGAQYAIDMAGVTINQAGAGRLVGNVRSAGGVVNVLSGATFVTEGTFEVGAFNIASGGTTRVASSSHQFTVAGELNNAGVLEVGEGVVANVSGDYFQSGTLRIAASSESSYGRVAATANVVLQPGANFDVNVNAVNTLSAGQRLDNVLSAGGSVMNNTGGTPGVTDSSALFDFQYTPDGNNVDLTIVPATAPPTAQPPTTAPAPSPSPSPAPGPHTSPSPSPVAGPAMSPAPAPQSAIVAAVMQNQLYNGVPAAEALDVYIQGGARGDDWDKVVTALGRLPTYKSVAIAVGQSMPTLHGNLGLVGIQHATATDSVVDQQLSDAVPNGDAAQKPERARNVWVKPLGRWAKQKETDDISGFDAATYGITGGVSADVGAGNRLGAGLAYLQTDVDGRDFAQGHSAKIEGVQMMGFGRHRLNDAGDSLSWQADYTRSAIDTKRTLSFINRVATGDTNANGWHVGMGISRALRLDDQTVMEPSIRLDWRQVKVDGYSETGAQALNLRSQSQTSEELVLQVGSTVKHSFKPGMDLLGGAYLGYDLRAKDQKVTAAYQGGGTGAFTTRGLGAQKARAGLSAGLQWKLGSDKQLSLAYGVEARQGLLDQNAAVRFDWQF